MSSPHRTGLDQARHSLPIFEVEADLVRELRARNRLILQAPTGSGKSTQVPQMLLDAGLLGEKGEVVILQPRRIAARMLAKRVAEERGVKLGEEVGYQIRLDNVTSERTRIRYVTEGILLRRMLSDPRLPGVAAILFDEFHERHLYGDITLGRALQIQAEMRPDLRLVVMSATLETTALREYLKPCAQIESAGRTYPVEIEYLPEKDESPIWDLAAWTVEDQLRKGAEGDFLIFMPGAFEIHRTIAAVRNSRAIRDAVVLPLHGELPPHEQDLAVGASDRRKIIVSTNVAETSLTIDGVRVVIDSGLARIARYDPYRGINTLLVEKISRASSDQRAGRAGRTAPGRCVRLWTEDDHGYRAPQELPEVRRLDLAEVVLTLKASGIGDISKFPWLDAPEAKSLARAETLLLDLGATQRRLKKAAPTATEGADETVITDIGRRMLRFPVHPRYARMLLAAGEAKCVRPVALIAALTQGRSLLLRSEGNRMDEARDEAFAGGETESDFFILMRAWRWAERQNFNPGPCQKLGIHAVTARQTGDLLKQFLDIAKGEGLPVDSDERPPSEAIQRCVLVGFSDHLAQRVDKGTLRCNLVHGRAGVLARESVVREAPLLVAAEVREIQRRGDELETLLNFATAVREEWLRELFPHDFSESSETVFEPTTRRVITRRRKLFRDLVLESGTNDKADLDAAAALLAKEVLAGRCPMKNWDDAVEQWILRVNCLRQWMPELELPAIGPDDRAAIIEQICHGSLGYKDIKEKQVWPTVKSWLSGQQQGWLDEYAPERIALPNGRKGKLTYSAENAPTLAAKLQDLYEVKESLWVAQRRIAVVIQVLAPNFRPIQVTTNLGTFWKDNYPKVKLELQRKYPRHEWR